MPITYTSTIEAQLVSGTWTDLSADVLASVRGKYGIDDLGPTGVFASSGELHFDLDNSAQNSGATLGWYSPNHASVRAGWDYGVAVRWILSHNTAASVSSITRSGTTATVTTAANHGLATNDYVTIAGAVQSAYNGTAKITVTGSATFTYTVAGAPATPATGTITWLQSYVRFRGKTGDIDPLPGQYRGCRVRVVCYDAMRDLIDAPAREVTVQINNTEDALLTDVLDALPSDAQPPARNLAAGLDTYPYAFDDLGSGVRAGGVVRDLVLSGLGLYFCIGDGTATYKTRHNRATAASAVTLTDSDIVEMRVPSTLDNVYNRVRATIHPKTIDAAATTVLWSQTGDAPEIKPGQTVTIWATYRDPTDETRHIGGTAQVVPLLASTDYIANSESGGGGSDLTSSVAITTTAFASTAKFVITNNHGTLSAFLTTLQIRGKGIYDNGPRTFESFAAKAYGDRQIELDMPYQDDPGLGQSATDYLRQQFDDLSDQVEMVELVASSSAARFVQAMTREPGDIITVTETVTGVSAVEAEIRSVELLMLTTKEVRCRWGLAPGAPFKSWLLGTTGASELGVTTLLGF